MLRIQAVKCINHASTRFSLSSLNHLPYRISTQCRSFSFSIERLHHVSLCSTPNNFSSLMPRLVRPITTYSKAHPNAGTESIEADKEHTRRRRRLKFLMRIFAYSAVAGVVTLAGLYSYSQRQSRRYGSLISKPIPMEGVPEGPVESDLPTRAPRSFFSSLQFAWRLALRVPRLIIIWVPVFVAYIFLDYGRWLNFACGALEKSGPVFIKFGQWASTRPDVFSKEVCSVLATLQANVRAHSDKFTMKQLRKSFTPEQLQYLTLGPLIGSGSMAQVHNGIIHLPGKEPINVAIKVLHPHTEERVGVDLLLLRLGATLISLWPGNRWLSLTESVEQFRILLDQHADLKSEAQNMLKFQHNFALWSDVKFASPIYPYITPTVLIQSLEEGVPLTDFMLSAPEQRVLAAETKVRTKTAAKPLRETDRRLAMLGLDMFLKMMVTDNFVHADLHPGNMLVNVKDEKKQQLAEARNKTNEQRQLRGEPLLPAPGLTLDYLLSIDPNHLCITVLDTALVTTLSPRNRVNFLSLFGAVVNGEGRVAARLMKDNAREQLVDDEEAYVNEMDALVSQVPNLNVKTTDVGQLLQRCMNIVRNHRVKIESDFASLIMSLIIVEGVGRRLDPRLNVIEESIKVFAHNPDAVKILWDQCGLKAINPLTVQAFISQLKSMTFRELINEVKAVFYNYLYLRRD